LKGSTSAILITSLINSKPIIRSAPLTAPPMGGEAGGRIRAGDVRGMVGVKKKLHPEDSTRFCRKVSVSALTNRFPISGKQILEAVEGAVGLLD